MIRITNWFPVLSTVCGHSVYHFITHVTKVYLILNLQYFYVNKLNIVSELDNIHGLANIYGGINILNNFETI